MSVYTDFMDRASRDVEAILDRIAKEAEKACLSDAELARRAGLHRSTVARTLGRKFVPKADVLAALARAVGLRLDV